MSGEPADTILRRSQTISEFCDEQNICRATFYNRRNEMPATIKIGAVVRITPEAKDGWRRAAERKTKELTRAAERKSAAAGAKAALRHARV